MDLLMKIFVMIGSGASIGFGVWHFFVPGLWNATTSLLWLTRVFLQVIYPQGSLYPGLQYGMLAAFTLVSLCYGFSLIMPLAKVPMATI